jgi:hypothetical protein
MSSSRHCQTTKEFNPLASCCKQICVPLNPEEYSQMIVDPERFRRELDPLIAEFPELFPSTIQEGYQLHDILPASAKMSGVRFRRIKVRATSGTGVEVFTIRPAFVLPYLTGYTTEVDKALFLRRWVPYWALVYVFGRDAAYWYRLENRFGRASLVGTTVKDPAKLPQNLLADEKFTDFNGQTAYIATTVAEDCVLGASITLTAYAVGLTEAYGRFKTEARQLCPTYQPATVNTDGWRATHLAWQQLFPLATLILCFLHAFITIRTYGHHLKEHFDDLKTKVWQTYQAADPELFMKKVEDLKTWAQATLPAGKGLEAVLKLCAKAPQFALAYQYPLAHRTSNMLDRHMAAMSRYLDTHHHYHGHLLSAEYNIRAWALFHNFWPYSPRAKAAEHYQSPAHKLNGRVYHPNWLHNLLISASMGGYPQ